MESEQLRLFQQDLQGLQQTANVLAQWHNLDGNFRFQLSRIQALEYQMCISWVAETLGFRQQYGEFKQVYIMDKDELLAVVKAFDEVPDWFV